MTEDLVAVVKPTERKTGTWSLSLPKDIIVQTGVDEAFKKGAKVPVYFDEKKRQVIYQLPMDTSKYVDNTSSA